MAEKKCDWIGIDEQPMKSNETLTFLQFILRAVVGTVVGLSPFSAVGQVLNKVVNSIDDTEPLLRSDHLLRDAGSHTSIIVEAESGR